jgi:hypothetical protein
MIIRHETAMCDCISLVHEIWNGRYLVGWSLRGCQLQKEFLLVLEEYHNVSSQDLLSVVVWCLVFSRSKQLSKQCRLSGDRS